MPDNKLSFCLHCDEIFEPKHEYDMICTDCEKVLEEKEAEADRTARFLCMDRTPEFYAKWWLGLSNAEIYGDDEDEDR